MQLEIPPVSHIYQDQAAKGFKILPGCVRNCIDFKQFSNMTFKFLMNKVKITLQLKGFFCYAFLNTNVTSY